MSRLAREHPEDERYQSLDGQRGMLEILEDGRLIDPRFTPEAERIRDEEFALDRARDEGWRV